MKTRINRMRTAGLPMLALLLYAGCGGGSSTSQKALAIGAWGQDAAQAGLAVTSSGATYYSDSGGRGVIPKPITIDGNGHFDVTGTYQLEGPPPPPTGPGYPVYSARYTGTVSGGTMTLTVFVNSSPSYTQGPYTLTYGKPITVPIFGVADQG